MHDQRSTFACSFLQTFSNFWFDWQAFAIQSCSVFQGLVAAPLVASTALVRLEVAATLIWYHTYVF